MRQNIASRFIQSGIFFLAAIIPLAFSPFAAELLDLTKVSILLIIPSVLLFFFFLRQRKNSSLKFSWTFLDQAVVMFGLIFGLATLFSRNIWHSLIGFDIYYGYTLAAIVGGILCYFLLRFQVQKGEQEQTLWLLFLLGGTAAAVLELTARFTNLLPSQFVQVISPSSAHSSLFLLIFIFIGEYQLCRQQRIGIQLLAGCCILINVFYLIVITARPTWIVLTMVTALFILLIRRMGVQRSHLLPLWIVLIFGLSTIFLPLFPAGEQSLLKLSSGTKLDMAWQTVRNHPFLGVGPNNFLFAFDHYRSAQFNEEPQALFIFVTATDLWMELLLTTGIIGFLAWIFLLIRLLPFRPWRDAGLAGPIICVLLLSSVFSSFTVLHWFLLWVCLAAIVNQRLEQQALATVKQQVAPQLLQMLAISTGIFSLLTGSVLGKIWLAATSYFPTPTNFFPSSYI